MKKVRLLSSFTAKILSLLFLLSALIACQEDKVVKPETISDIVLTNSAFSILNVALRHAGMEDALKTGPLTVFAPSDAAFRAAGYADAAAVTALPAATVRRLIQYHILGKTVRVTDIGSGTRQKEQTILKRDISLVKNSSGTFVNGVKIVAADLEADNGVVHVIDRLLTP